MILRFLRLFYAFRQLEDGFNEMEKLVQYERDCTAMARNDVTHWRTRGEAAESRVRELTDKLLEDRGRVADAMSIRVIGKRVFSKADVSEITAVPQTPIAPSRMMGRQAVAENTRRFFEEALTQKDAPVA